MAKYGGGSNYLRPCPFLLHQQRAATQLPLPVRAPHLGRADRSLRATGCARVSCEIQSHNPWQLNTQGAVLGRQHQARHGNQHRGSFNARAGCADGGAGRGCLGELAAARLPAIISRPRTVRRVQILLDKLIVPAGKFVKLSSQQQ